MFLESLLHYLGSEQRQDVCEQCSRLGGQQTQVYLWVRSHPNFEHCHWLVFQTHALLTILQRKAFPRPMLSAELSLFVPCQPARWDGAVT